MEFNGRVTEITQFFEQAGEDSANYFMTVIKKTTKMCRSVRADYLVLHFCNYITVSAYLCKEKPNRISKARKI